MSNNEIVQKLWNLCDVLRDDGINYSDYVTELVLLLFIILAVASLFVMGGKQADSLIENYGLAIFGALYVVSLPIVWKGLSR